MSLVLTIQSDGTEKWVDSSSFVPASSGGLPPGWVSPEQFGAVGSDGVPTVDETSAVQQAIAAASVGASPSWWFGGRTVFLRRNYLVSNLTYPVSGLTFKGNGERTSGLWQKAGAAGAIIGPAVVDATTAYLSLVLEDMILAGDNNKSGVNTIGVDLTSARGCTVNRVRFGFFTKAGVLVQCGPNAATGANDSVFHRIKCCDFENLPAPSVLFATNPADLKASGQGYSVVRDCVFNTQGIGVGGCGTSVRILDNVFMQCPNPFNLAGMGNRFERNHNECSTPFSVTIPATGPGQGSQTGIQTSNTIIAENVWARQPVTYHDGGQLTVTRDEMAPYGATRVNP